MFNIKLTPATIFMLPLAVGLDVAGILLLCFGLDDFGITDAIGIVFIDTWLFFQGSRTVKGNRGLSGFFQKAFKGNVAKYVTPTTLEMIPYVGALPMWTISILYNLSQDQ
jgi:hypothetical protein